MGNKTRAMSMALLFVCLFVYLFVWDVSCREFPDTPRSDIDMDLDYPIETTVEAALNIHAATASLAPSSLRVRLAVKLVCLHGAGLRFHSGPDAQGKLQTRGNCILVHEQFPDL